MIFRQGTPLCVFGLLDLTYTSFMYYICLLGLYRWSYDFLYLGFVRRLGIQIIFFLRSDILSFLGFEDPT